MYRQSVHKISILGITLKNVVRRGWAEPWQTTAWARLRLRAGAMSRRGEHAATQKRLQEGAKETGSDED